MTIRIVSNKVFLHDGCPKAVEGKPVVVLVAYPGEAPPKFRCTACNKEWWAVPASDWVRQGQLLVGHMVEWQGQISSCSDAEIGDRLAEVIGDTFINWNEMTPVEQWIRITKILRLHGINLSQFVLGIPADGVKITPFNSEDIPQGEMSAQFVGIEVFKVDLSRKFPTFADAIQLAEAMYGKLTKIEADVHSLTCFLKTTMANIQLTFQSQPAEPQEPPPIGADW